MADFSLIGNTPTIRLKNIEKHYGLKAKLYAKCEWLNLTGSVKDRAALNIIRRAEERGELKKGYAILEATSGNMGISFAAIAKMLGYKSIIVMPENMSDERKRLIKAYGAELYLTPKSEGMKGSIDKCEEISKKREVYIPRQFENKDNAEAHFLTTAPEICSQVKDMAAFVAGIGTGGTITGCGEYFKSDKSSCKNIKIFGVEPFSSPILNGGKAGGHQIQGIGANFIPKLLKRELIDEVFDIQDEEAFSAARLLAEKEGLLVGISSGAALAGALKAAKMQEFSQKSVVTLFPDGGLKYMSTALFSE